MRARSLLPALVVAATLSGCTSAPEPLLLDPDDFDAVLDVQGTADDGTFWSASQSYPACTFLNVPLVGPGTSHEADHATIWLGSGSSGARDDQLALATAPSVGAYLASSSTYSDLGRAARELLAVAEDCVAEGSLVALDGLPEGVVGWRSEGSANGVPMWGELAVAMVGDRLLAVRLLTPLEEAPIAIEDLLELAREGAPRRRCSPPIPGCSWSE